MVTIRDIMRKSVVTVGPKTTVTEASKVMANNKIGSVIILKDAKPWGIVTADDVTALVAKGQDPKKKKVEDIASKKLVTAEPQENILKVVKRMLKGGVKRVPVIRNGQLVGIVSDKEIMLSAPEMVDVLSERLRARVSMTSYDEGTISGLCEDCEVWCDDLQQVNDRWLCEDCRESD